jgi:division/cell wall cluster transcriptional repressor MraZ
MKGDYFMFGSSIIVGSKTISLDKKNRIIIPKFTGAEPKDRIITRLNFYRNKLFIESIEQYQETSKQFEEFLKSMQEKGKISSTEKRQYQRYFYGVLSNPYEELDSQRRMVLNCSIIKNLKLYDSVFVIGRESHLELYSNEETYHILNTKRK